MTYNETIIKALSAIALDPEATELEQADARNEILLMVGAIHGYYDHKGIQRQSLDYAYKYGSRSNRETH
ncbi:hypothetical protein [Paraburkholderia sp. BL10I2N1]|uniref:hypothetical protein n=1 Tax=Paraburkholderia sp. BL10I2N1 TaxID=1938796 RepID=UPI001060DD2D|nr:hypothetical protein [Paraburkholderia sp. BL10I2N1]TDN69095.1 hypothetical protein B0G77_2464 [Paraburkholderia sp. BL10I2N1]